MWLSSSQTILKVESFFFFLKKGVSLTTHHKCRFFNLWTMQNNQSYWKCEFFFFFFSEEGCKWVKGFKGDNTPSAVRTKSFNNLNVYWFTFFLFNWFELIIYSFFLLYTVGLRALHCSLQSQIKMNFSFKNG